MAIRLSRDVRLIRFPSSDGFQLEGRLVRADPGRAVVLCHPHPLYGGSMLTPVIMTAEQAFQEDFAFLQSAACRIALIGASRDQFCDRGRLEAFFSLLPRKAWLRVLDTDHSFSGALDDLAESCRDVITWARGEEGG